MSEVTTRRRKTQPVQPALSGMSFETYCQKADQEEARAIAQATNPAAKYPPKLSECLQSLEEIEWLGTHHTSTADHLCQAICALLQQEGKLSPMIETLLDLARNHMELLGDHLDSICARNGAWTTSSREAHDVKQGRAA